MAGARLQDLGYDAVHAKGLSGVLLDTHALPADFNLIGNEFGLATNPFNGATFKEKGATVFDFYRYWNCDST